MLIDLSSLFPDCNSCIVPAHEIEYITIEEASVHGNRNNFLVVKLAIKKKPIILRPVGYTNNLTPEVMSKAAFTINAAVKPKKGTT